MQRFDILLSERSLVAMNSTLLAEFASAFFYFTAGP